jgi:hypothetical protein
MKELRFDFSAPALPQADVRATTDWHADNAGRRGRSDTAISPAIRLVFLSAIALNAVLSACVMGVLAGAAGEKILPLASTCSKLKAATEVRAAACFEAAPVPRPSDDPVSPPIELPVPIMALPFEPDVADQEPEADENADVIQVYQESQPGESPMLHNWKTLKFAAAMAAALSAAHLASAQEQESAKTILDRLGQMDSEIKKSFQNLQLDMKTLQGRVIEHRADIDLLKTKVSDLEDNLKLVRDQLDDLRKKLPGEIALFSPVTKDNFEELRNRLSNIEQKLNESSSRVALSPSGTVGRLMLVNLYNEDLVFTVNGQTYRVPAGRTMPVDNVPAGAVSYELISPTWGRRAQTTTRLAANETLTLTAQ